MPMDSPEHKRARLTPPKRIPSEGKLSIVQNDRNSFIPPRSSEIDTESLIYALDISGESLVFLHGTNDPISGLRFTVKYMNNTFKDKFSDQIGGKMFTNLEALKRECAKMEEEAEGPLPPLIIETDSNIGETPLLQFSPPFWSLAFQTLATGNAQSGFFGMIEEEGELMRVEAKFHFQSSNSTLCSLKVESFFPSVYPGFQSFGLQKQQWLQFLSNTVSQYYCALEFDQTANDVKILFVNNSLAQMLGTTESQAIGKWMKRDIDNADSLAEWWITSALETLGSPIPKSFESRWEKPSKFLRSKVYYVDSCPRTRSKTVLSSKSGNNSQMFHRFFFLMEDRTNDVQMMAEISDGKDKLEEIGGYNKLLETFFNAAPSGMGAVSILPEGDDLVYNLSNISTCRLLNRPLEDIRGKKWSEVDIPLERRMAWIESCRQSESLRKPVQLEWESSDSVLSCVTYSLGNNNFIYVWTDISYRKQLEERLRMDSNVLEATVQERTKQLNAAMEAKTRFLATMSHEIRTPLSGVIGSLSMLQNAEINQEHREMIRIAQVCGEQLLMVINDILDLSKIEGNKMTLELTPLYVQSILDQCLEMVTIQAEKKGLELICDSKIPPGYLASVDSVRIRQILINLLSNSIKFTQTGEIVLRASIESTTKNAKGSNECCILFSVSDTGIGISDEVKPNLFLPFSQGDTSITRKFGGTGLGLCISKLLAELMGGKMWFESTPNVGSTFYFTVIAESFGINPQKAGGDYSLLPEIIDQLKSCNKEEKKSVAVINQNPQARHQIVEQLKGWGFYASSFESVPQFLTTGSADMVVAESTENGLSVEALETNCKHVVYTGYNPNLKHSSSDSGIDSPNSSACGLDKRSAQQNFLMKPVKQTSLALMLDKFFLNSKFNDMKHTMPAAVELSKDKMALVRILLAEDNRMNQKVIGRLLSSLGAKRVTIVDNGKKAVEAVRSQRFDVVLMDCMMPEMDGIEATSRIRSLTGIHQPKILALTADVFVENRERCLKAGMDDVLTKPINQKHLSEVFASFLTPTSTAD